VIVMTVSMFIFVFVYYCYGNIVFTAYHIVSKWFLLECMLTSRCLTTCTRPMSHGLVRMHCYVPAKLLCIKFLICILSVLYFIRERFLYDDEMYKSRLLI